MENSNRNKKNQKIKIVNLTENKKKTKNQYAVLMWSSTFT